MRNAKTAVAHHLEPFQNKLRDRSLSKVWRSFSRAGLTLSPLGGIAAQAGEHSILGMQALTGPSAFVGAASDEPWHERFAGQGGPVRTGALIHLA